MDTSTMPQEELNMRALAATKKYAQLQLDLGGYRRLFDETQALFDFSRLGALGVQDNMERDRIIASALIELAPSTTFVFQQLEILFLTVLTLTQPLLICSLNTCRKHVVDAGSIR